MTDEMRELLSKYQDEFGHIQFTAIIDRSFHDEEWQETVANLDSVLKFAKWYAKHTNKGEA